MTEVVGMICRLFCQLLIPRATHAQVKGVITSIISLNFPGRKSNVHVVRSKYAMGTKFCSYAKTNKWWKWRSIFKTNRIVWYPYSTYDPTCLLIIFFIEVAHGFNFLPYLSWPLLLSFYFQPFFQCTTHALLIHFSTFAFSFLNWIQLYCILYR